MASTVGGAVPRSVVASERSPLLRSSSSSSSLASAVPRPAPPPRLPLRVLAAVLVGLYLGVFLSALDSTIVATILTRIGSDFERSNGASLSRTGRGRGVLPLYGRLSDVFGRRRALLTALSIFLVGSAFCGLSPSLLSLIASRALAGLGGGGVLTCVSIVMTDLVPLRDRGRFQGYTNAVFGSAAMLGAPLGGWLADAAGWRYAFWINLPIGLAAAVTVAYFLRPPYYLRDTDEAAAAGVNGASVWERVLSVDYAGCVLLVAGMTALVLALTWAGNELEWSDPTILALLAAAAALIAAFVFVEARVASQPIMPMRLMLQRTPAACYAMNFFSSMAALSTVFLIPLWFQVVIGTSTAESGSYIVPKIVSSSLGSITSGIYMGRTGSYRRITQMAAVGMYILEIAVDGFSFGTILTSTLIGMLAAIARTDIAVGSAMSYLFRATGSVFGVALSQSALQAVLKARLEATLGQRGPAGRAAADLARHAAADLRAVLPPEFLPDAIAAYEDAIRAAFAVCLACAAVSLLASLAVQDYDLGASAADQPASSSSSSAAAPRLPARHRDRYGAVVGGEDSRTLHARTEAANEP
ncbi:hypothetical protein HK405_006347 [Cladochytrium tenue]|nr:hypothetical protein HK405_006347 [Cladochytrium tenue]